MTDPISEVGRLAMRVEGETWVAYYALPGTMKGAIRLGSIAMRLVAGGPREIERKWAFMGLEQSAVADLLEDMTGQRPDMNHVRNAPESERAGRA